MGLELRSATERHNSKYNSDLLTLNTEFEVFKSVPKIVDRQRLSRNSEIYPVIYHLKAQ